jgi:hypothetical protein
VRLWLSALAYNLANQWQRLALLEAMGNLVAHQLAAAAGENRRTVDRARLDFITNRQAGAKRLVSFPFNARCEMSLGSPLLRPVSVLGV